MYVSNKKCIPFITASFDTKNGLISIDLLTLCKYWHKADFQATWEKKQFYSSFKVSAISSKNSLLEFENIF